ncbi:MAG: VCBS repeat-containing protein [Scytolyngbya sp. HA4215-MV1]|jgi:hypothetical protein|nr:VCBS repeat-containing protein [Scytolyngbya sp. HA4215-MV1]
MPHRFTPSSISDLNTASHANAAAWLHSNSHSTTLLETDSASFSDRFINRSSAAPAQALVDPVTNQRGAVASAAPALATTSTNSNQANIVWVNTTTGQTLLWQMNGTTATTQSSLPTLGDLNWKIAANADFTGDGQADILLRNATTGAQAIWQMNGVNAIATVNVGPAVVGANWQIEAAADFTGDGQADILWRDHGTGNQVIWQMNHTTAVATINNVGPTVTDANWKIEAAADFTGDGQADIVWRNYATGNQVIWQMNHAIPIATVGFGVTVGGANWHMAGAGDFTGDGRPDILWRNETSGLQVIWQMSGTTAVATLQMNAPAVPGAQWQATTLNLGGDWFTRNLVDPSLRDLARNLDRDGQLSRTDMLSILNQTGLDNLVSGAELSDLRSLVSGAVLLGMPDYVKILTNKVVNSDPANQSYQGNSLGNLTVGSSGNQLTTLVSKWFLGMDHPFASDDSGSVTLSYHFANGSLFQNGISYQDINQGNLGNCYFLASLSSIAANQPNIIQNMFIDNGDNTFTVRFFNNGVADYVTVDRNLPTWGNGQFAFAHPSGSAGGFYYDTSNELWVALAEKAYAQLNESGWIRQDNTNSYQGISGGFLGDALSHITGRAGTIANGWGSMATEFNAVVSAIMSGQFVGFATGDPGTTQPGIVPGHAYSVVGYNATTQMFTLFNPWGESSPVSQYGQGTLQMSWNDILDNFIYWDGTTV